MPKIPNWYMEQQKRYPKVIEAYERLGEATLGVGPLDGKTRSLAKLGIAVGSRHEGAVRSHVRKTLEAGATLDECRHVVLMSMTTIGFPSMMAALSWVEDVAKKS